MLPRRVGIRQGRSRWPVIVLAVAAAVAVLAPPASGTGEEGGVTRATVLGGGRRPPPAGWVRALDENFTSALGPGRWNRCHWWDDGGCTIASNDELEWYLPGNVTVADGRLHLEARPEDVVTPSGAEYDYASGMVTTGPPRYRTPAKFAFRYGYVEARLWLPAGRGLWPAFWLLPADQESRPEIDVVEVLCDDTSRARFHYHYRDERGVRRSFGHSWSGPDLAAGWHRFAVDWRPGSITWIVDGRARWRVTGPAVSSERMYLVLNLAVGGNYPGPPDGTTVFPAEVQADWIRVWRDPDWR
jgi:beta-glucanase (GH16 family)